MQLILFIILIIILIAICLSFLNAVWAANSLAPWVPSKKRDLQRIFKLAALKPNETFYDSGCGNGKVVFYACKNFPVKAVGLEIFLPLFLICKIRQFFHRGANLTFKYKNLFKEDLSAADVVYVFGMPRAIKNKLKQKLERELKPGSRVISYTFPITGWVPEIIDKPNKGKLSIYLYKIKI